MNLSKNKNHTHTTTTTATTTTIMSDSSPPEDLFSGSKELQKLNVKAKQNIESLVGPAGLRTQDINMAVNIAKARERFRWEVGYLTALSLGTGVRWFQTLKFPVAMLLPISAVAMYTAYEWDYAYGSKLRRINEDALRIMRRESYRYFRQH